MSFSIPEYVRALIQKLDQSGFECYIVGGAVRNALLGLPVHDYDLTTNALPDEMKAVFHGYPTIETGLRHGTLTVLSDRHPVEITTYRKDSSYQDHRHPDHVTFTSALKDDCRRRDFTINAMCCRPDEEVIDFFGGREDLRKRIIRCIGLPEERFDEDALRILRAIRFSARLSFAIDEDTGKAIHKQKDTLSFVSKERIHEELKGILEGNNLYDLLYEYSDVFSLFLPFLNALTEHEKKHLFQIVSDAANDPEIRMALLLNNEPNAETILKSLKYSRKEIRTILCLIKNKDIFLKTRSDMKKAMCTAEENTIKLISFYAALHTDTEEKSLLALHDDILARKECYSLKDLAVNGRDLMACGYHGKQIRLVLEKVLTEVISERLPNKKEALLNWIRQSSF